MSKLEQIKAFIREKCPVCLLIVAQIRILRLKCKSMKSIFSDIYHRRGAGAQESVSGPGSDLVQTSVIRQEIPIVIREINARSLLDAACGDFYWMRETELYLDRYIGVDIVPDVIVQNRQKYGDAIREFLVMDITKDNLPQVDLILCRDCLVHLSYKHIISVIANFKKSKSEYLLITTFTRLAPNRDTTTGIWRPINWELPPFNFPKPIKLINEGCTEGDGKYSDKSLGLWKLEDIPDYE